MIIPRRRLVLGLLKKGSRATCSSFYWHEGILLLLLVYSNNSLCKRPQGPLINSTYQPTNLPSGCQSVLEPPESLVRYLWYPWHNYCTREPLLGYLWYPWHNCSPESLLRYLWYLCARYLILDCPAPYPTFSNFTATCCARKPSSLSFPPASLGLLLHFALFFTSYATPPLQIEFYWPTSVDSGDPSGQRG
jgi:hypothetical protein